MDYSKKTSTFGSSDGIHTLHYDLFIPSSEIKAVMLIIHGMSEMRQRYEGVQIFFAENGIAAFCYDQLGHGETATDDSEKGWFGDKNGPEYLVRDVDSAIKLLKEEFPGKKLILLGHSFGSFIARYYVYKYQNGVDALILSGTSGGRSGLDIGIKLSSLIGSRKGRKYRSPLINWISMGSSNKRFIKLGEHSPNAWLSRDKKIQSFMDEKAFVFTSQGFGDMFYILKTVTSGDWYKTFPKNMPVLISSGEEDPIGDYGKGVKKVYARLKAAEVKDLTLKIYPECRHEILNEINRVDVYSDFLAWIKERYCV